MEMAIPPKGRFPQFGVIDEELIRKSVEAERKLEEEQTNREELHNIALTWDPIDLPKLEELRLSYSFIAKIDNLVPLDSLRVLRLDNNNITKIENLDHLVHLQWLDLSFNAITEISGLDTLTGLRDLSLYHNKITALTGLDHLTQLQVLSIGSNEIESLDSLTYLRKIDTLEVLNVAGNPFTSDADFRSSALTLLPRLKFLDYIEVTAAEQQAAKEQQHVMTELHEGDIARQAAAKEAAESAERTKKLAAANLTVIASIVDHLFQEDEDGMRLLAFPAVQDMNASTKETLATIVAESTDKGFESAELLTKELEEVKAALQYTRETSDESMRKVVFQFAKKLKRLKLAFQAADESGMSDREASEQLAKLKTQAQEVLAENMARRDVLYEEELQLSEQCSKLVSEFETQYGDLTLKRAEFFGQFFRAVEKEIDSYKENVAAYLQSLVEKAAADPDDEALDALNDDSKALLQDRESLLASVSASFDSQVSKLLAAEDAVRGEEKSRAKGAVNDLAKEEALRNRQRICEIEALFEHDKKEVEELITEYHEEDEG